MEVTAEPFSIGCTEEVLAFFRRSNPFAQHTWGWDTGRFIDWRWGSNHLRALSSPGWFAAHAAVFRASERVQAVAIAESGSELTCIVTESADPAIVTRVVRERMTAQVDVALEFADSADWLAAVAEDLGLERTPNTGCEWEFDLALVADKAGLPDGFSIDGLSDERTAEYHGISDCIKAAFGSDRDQTPVLWNLEQNPLFRPELSVVARGPDGIVAAYCRGTVDPDTGVAGIDPVCTHPDFQRMGLGAAVVAECFRRQRMLGGTHSYIGSAPEPAPGSRLYRSLGPSRVQVSSTWRSPGDF